MTTAEVLSGPEKGESWNGMRYLLGLSERKSREVYWTHRHDYDRGALSGTEHWSNIARDVA